MSDVNELNTLEDLICKAYSCQTRDECESLGKCRECKIMATAVTEWFKVNGYIKASPVNKEAQDQRERAVKEGMRTVFRLLFQCCQIDVDKDGVHIPYHDEWDYLNGNNRSTLYSKKNDGIPKIIELWKESNE